MTIETQLTAKLDSVQPILSMIKPLCLNQVLYMISIKLIMKKAVITVAEQGIKISVDYVRSIQAHSYLPSSLFREWSFVNGSSEEILQYEIHLDALVDCLTVFGTSAPFTNHSSSHQSTLQPAVCISISSGQPHLLLM